MSSRSYTQSDGMLESGGGGRLKLLDVGEEVGTGEEIVGTGGGGYFGILLLLLFLRGKAGSS